MVKKYPWQRWKDKKKKTKKKNQPRTQTKDPSWKESSVDDVKGKKKIKVKGWLLWGYKPKIVNGERYARDGRQLGSGTRLKKDADKEATKWRKKGYVVSVQEMLSRKPRGS